MMEENYLRERPSGFFGFASTLCLRSAESKQVLLLLSLLAEVKSTKNQTKNLKLKSISTTSSNRLYRLGVSNGEPKSLLLRP